MFDPVLEEVIYIYASNTLETRSFLKLRNYTSKKSCLEDIGPLINPYLHRIALTVSKMIYKSLCRIIHL
jgi:hypothetical protein